MLVQYLPVEELDEAKFVRGVRQLPKEYLERQLDFAILPNEMKDRLHKNLQEVSPSHHYIF